MNATKKIVFGTGNQHKLDEVLQLLDGRVEVVSLSDIGYTGDLPETSDSISGNALQKARHLHQICQMDCFAEDTGLEIDALGGEPGVRSARYAGPARDSESNMALVLKKLGNSTDRRARFRTVIALIIDGREHLFEGIAPGTIRHAQSGSGGFGYDPIFQPDGYEKTFAEMAAATKNAISHRGQAVRQLIDFLKKV
ncbi:MAG: RdgB/HAM1 family non-canonical purine NTP pyrophosphatase [Saprospiraceae bacterium]